MPTFALAAEGLTDQIIVERIIEEIAERHFEDDVEVHPLQPLRDSSDAFTAPHGGWELVFEFCKIRAADALASNDFLVVHIDTDQGDHENFGLNLTDGGVDRPIAALVEDAAALLKRLIGPQLYAENSHRIIFAVSVHTIESWLLLSLYNKDEPKSSFKRLQAELAKGKVKGLTKTVDRYTVLANNLKYKKIIVHENGDNSLSIFIRSLNSLAKQ